MKPTLLTLGLLSAIFAPAILAAGCASSDNTRPYSLTGESQEQIQRDHQDYMQRMRYTDEKGHYRPDLEAADRPVR